MYSTLHGNDNNLAVYYHYDDDDIAPPVSHLYVSCHSELRELKIRLLFNCGIEIQKLLGLIYKCITVMHEDNKKLHLN